MKLNASDLKTEERAALLLRGLYERHGYKKYKMSNFEEYRLYMENKSFLASESVITFTDERGRLMALKPDVTLSIAKRFRGGDRLSEKVYYTESVYRPAKDTRSFREISQMGLEYMGNIDLYAIAEVVSLALSSLEAVSPSSVLELSHMGFVLGLLEELGVKNGDGARLNAFISAKNRHGLSLEAERVGLSEKDAQRLCEIPSLYGDFETVIARASSMATNGKMKEALGELQRLYAALSGNGRRDKIQLDLSIINDIDYYNGIIFQGYIEGLPRGVLAGGQYDRILGKYTGDAGAIGFALYLSELAALPSEKRAFDFDVLVRYQEGADAGEIMRTVREFADKGLTVRAVSERENPDALRFREKVDIKAGEKGEREC